MASETQPTRGIPAGEEYRGPPEVGLDFYGGRRQVTRYVKDWTLANRFSIIVAKAGTVIGEIKAVGTNVIYLCNSATPCQWRIVAYLVCRDDTPAGTYRIQGVQIEHSDMCTRTVKATVRQAAAMLPVQRMVLLSRSTPGRTIASMVQEEGGGSVSKNAFAARVREEVMASLGSKSDNTYSHIPWLLREFSSRNGGSLVDLELDTEKRFYRAFVSFGASIEQRRSHVPVLGTDGTFFKTKEYPGVLLNLVQRDAYAHNIVLAFAIVPSETAENYLWFLRLCMDAGVTFVDFALFADRGKVVSAVATLRDLKYIIPLKHCTIHLLRNLKTQFSLESPTFKNAIWKLQAASSSAKYDKALAKIKATFCKDDDADKAPQGARPVDGPVSREAASVSAVSGSVDVAHSGPADSAGPSPIDVVVAAPSTSTPSKGKGKKKKEQDVVAYLKAIGPEHWTVYGNMEAYKTQPLVTASAALDVRALFGVRTTNFVESDNAKNIHNGLRFNLPFAALYLMMAEVMQTAATRRREVELESSSLPPPTLTKFARDDYEKSLEMAQAYTIQESTRSILYVYRESHLEAKREVDVENLKCSCPYREQTQMPCKHLIRALEHVSALHRIDKCFHEMYKFENYKRAVMAVSYRLPLYADRKPEGPILPPKVVARAGRTQSKRIASSGESGTAGKAKKVYQQRGAARSAPYKCKSCGGEGHNAATCSKQPRKLLPATSSGRSYFKPDVPRTYDRIQVCNLIHASDDEEVMLNDEADFRDVDEDGFELGGTGLESILALLNE